MAIITPLERTLSNGLRLVVCPDHGSATVTVDVMYRVGSHDERPERTGLAHLFEHLMFDNTSTGIDKQYDVYCTRAGGSNNAYTTYDFTNYYISVPSHQLDLGLWLEAERMRQFAITEQALATQRSVVIEEIKQNVENQPYGRWRFALDPAAYDRRSGYSWEVYGSADHVAAVRMDDARDFFTAYYRPSNAVLCIAGDVDAERAFAKAEEQFGGIADPALAIDRRPFDPAWCRRGTHDVVPDDVPMPAVYVSFHLPGFLSTDMADAEILATALGAGRRSALYRRLVSDRRVASSAGAFVDRRAHASLLTLYAYASRPDVTADVLASELIETATTFRIDAAQRETAINKLATSLAMELQRNNGVADTVAWTTLFWNDSAYCNRAMGQYHAVSLDALHTLSSDVLRADQAIRIDVVPDGSDD